MAQSSEPHHLLPGPQHLNATGCTIKVSEERGRGVYASQPILRNTTIEISPVLFFSKQEYEEHGKHTVLDRYTFKWPDGRMALALGLGSLFNHSDSPNVSFTLETSKDSIRYATTRDISPGEELCIFYGHKLWFTPSGAAANIDTSERSDDDNGDGWTALSIMDFGELGENKGSPPVNPFAGRDLDEIIPEDSLPITRYKLPAEEEDPESVCTIPAWVVEVPEQRSIATLLKWLKQTDLDTPDLNHLKRVRKQNNTTAFLLASQTAFPLDPPPLPKDLSLPPPCLRSVPASSALTQTQLALKTALWPTMYTPRRKGEQEKWSQGKASWAWQAMQKTVQTAIQSYHNGEFPIAVHIPAPYEEASSQNNRPSVVEVTAHDTRTSANHPLRHAVINAIRKMAEFRAAASTSSSPLATSEAETDVLISPEDDDKCSNAALQNGTNYLLTTLTIFATHEPCIMCSMALLHSRVKEVIYLLPMPQTGGCGGGTTCLPTLKGVNHRYSIAQWKAGASYRVVDDVEADRILNIGTTIDA